MEQKKKIDGRCSGATYKDTIWYQSYEARKFRREHPEVVDKERRLKRCKKYGERAVDNAFVRAAEEAHAFTTKMHPMSNAGIPDRILHFNDRTYYVEMKATGAKCSPLQIEMHKRLRNYGVDTFVLDTVIKDLFELWDFAYTTYPSNHYDKNPHKDATE